MKIPKHIDFHLFNVLTRRLHQSHRTASTIELVELQAAELGEGDEAGNLGWVLGHYRNVDLLYVDREGQVRRLPPSGEIPPLDLPPYE